MRPNTIIMGFLEQETHRDELGHPESPFYDEHLAAINFSNTANKMSALEYVSTLNDILKLGKPQMTVLCTNTTLSADKNVVLCRHFQHLNETDLFHDTRKHIDIWPMDFSNGMVFSISDQSFLFLLQIACIVHMTDNWKKLKLRLFHFIESEEGQEEMRNLLENLRIRGETVLCRERPDQGVEGVAGVNRFLK